MFPNLPSKVTSPSSAFNVRISGLLTVGKGQRIGIIKFGSRIDIYVPEDYITDIKAGDEVIAGETILFTKKNKENVLE